MRVRLLGKVVDGTAVAVRGAAAAVRRHPLGAFFLLAHVFSWAYWIPLALTASHVTHFPGLLGPMAAAFMVAAVRNGGAGPQDLLRRMARWRVPLRWYAAALVPAGAGLVALGALAVSGRGLPSVDELSTMPGVPSIGWLGVFALVLVINGYGEEVGWRGFAWPHLRERHTLGGAALFLTVFWATWHIPVFWLDTGLRGFDPVVIPGWIVGLVAGAVVLGWLYERSGSSLLIVAVFHALLNMASATTGTEGVPAAVVTTVVIVWAVVILRHSRSGRSTSSLRPELR